MPIRRLIALLLAACLLGGAFFAFAQEGADPLPLTEEEAAFVADADVLRVGYVTDRIPISFKGESGELEGVSRYIFDRVSALSGLTFEYVPLPSGAVTYDVLLEGKYDLVTSVEYNKQNLGARGILTSEPYFSSRKVVVGRESLNFDYNAPFTVAISSGSQTIEKVLKETFPNATLHNYGSIPQCFDAVRSGEADLLIQNQYVAEYLISRPAYEGLKVVPMLDLEDQLCFSAVVSFDGREGPSNEDGQVLISILNKAIDRLSEDELSAYTIQAIMENPYTFTFSDLFYRYRFTFLALGLSFAAIILLTVLLMRLRVRALADRAETKAKGQFLSTMSHEIRTPLNGLIGLNYLMTQKLDDRALMRDYLQKSTVTAKYLLALVNDILDMSELKDRKLTLIAQRMDLKLLFSAVTDMVQNMMDEKQLSFTVDIDLPAPWVVGDESRIAQVVLNLLNNARKFTPNGGRVALSVHQEAPGPDGKVRTEVTVADTGRGISDEFKAHLFDSFARDLDTVSKGNQGTGLGLPICLSLARLMEGDLTYDTVPGKGSTFRFTFSLPKAEPPAGDGSGGEEKPLPAKVLVAEDNELNAEILMEILREENIACVYAENGQQALEAFRASEVGELPVILMDLQMPAMDGCAAARAIRALDRPDAATVRIFACTANTADEDRDRAIAAGMNAFIAKPIDAGALLQKLRE